MIDALFLALATGGARPRRSARYWRFLATDVSWSTPNPATYGNYFQAIREFRLYAAGDGSGSSLCYGYTATATQWHASFPPGNARDDVTASYWQSNDTTNPAIAALYWQIDFGAGVSKTPRSASILPYGDGSASQAFHAKSYALQWSDTGLTGSWTTLATLNTTNSSAEQFFTNLQ